MKYVDGFVIPVPKKNIKAYQQMSRKAGKIWLEYGALQYIETVGDDLNVKQVLPFPKVLKIKRGETVVFSWIVYKSKAHRDKVNAKVMSDPRLAKMMDPSRALFDWKRMTFGGFKTIVELQV